jgi:hypothetical protein
MALIKLYSENTRGRDVLKDFDLVAANSGGSLVLGGLLENLTLGEVKNLFESEKIRSSIFSPTSSWGDSALRAITGMGPKYSAQAKLPAIQALTPTFGKKTLKEAAAGIKRTGAKEELRLLSSASTMTAIARFFSALSRIIVRDGAMARWRRLRSRKPFMRRPMRR